MIIRCHLHNHDLPCPDCVESIPRDHDQNVKHMPLATVKTDIDIAREFRQQIADAMQPVLTIMQDAKRLGFDCQFGIASDATGRPHLAQLQIVKVFT